MRQGQVGLVSGNPLGFPPDYDVVVRWFRFRDVQRLGTGRREEWCQAVTYRSRCLVGGGDGVVQLPSFSSCVCMLQNECAHCV